MTKTDALANLLTISKILPLHTIVMRLTFKMIDLFYFCNQFLKSLRGLMFYDNL